MKKPIFTGELLSDDLQEVISYRPGWVIRKGNSFFFLILFVLFLLSFIIKYPDVVNAPARLTAINPPLPINAKKQGKLLKLFAHNEQQVEKGTLLGYIESGAGYEEVMQLQAWVQKTIDETKYGSYNTLLAFPLPLLTNLGTLQPPYQEFQNQLAYTRQTLANGYYNKKSNALQKDLRYLSALKHNAYQQQDLITADQQLQQKEFEAYESLARDKVIAPLELNQVKSKLIAKQQNLKQVNVLLTNTDMSSHGKQKEIIDLQKQVADQQQNFHSSLLTLKSTIEAWIDQYVLTASESGKLLFTSSLQENELINSGQSLFYILPQQSKFFVEITASQNGLGKLSPGQKVMLKVDSYPSAEYGSLTGMVEHIAEIPNRNDSFLIKAALPNGLKTNYGKTVFFRSGLTAHAEIITDNRKLFDRLAGQLKQLW